MKASPQKLDSKDVGIWIRVSTDDQARGESPALHEERARHYAKFKGWNVREVYHLEGVSGKSVVEHPEAKRMLTDVREGRISGLIFSKLARLARNTRELLDFADRFQECHADLISLHEAIDTSTPAGRLFYTVIAAMAQFEREEVVDRLKSSIAIRAKLGKPLGGPAPFGYAWKDKKLVSDPKEAPIRKQMYELFLQHKRKKTVTRLLNEAGYRTRNGARFTPKTVGRLLEDPTAKGLRRGNYTTRTGPKENWKFKPESEWVFTEVDPIVSEDLWQQCNDILAQAEKPERKPAKKVVHVFAGLTVCGCGQPMYVPANTPKYVCQKCRNKIPIVDLDSGFYEHLTHFFIAPQNVADHIQDADRVLKEKQGLLAVQQRELEKIKKETDIIYGLVVEGHLAKEDFGRRQKDLAERQQQLETSIPRLQAEIDLATVNQLSGDEIIAEATDLQARWPNMDAAEKRQIVEAITERITVTKDEVAIRLFYIPSGKELSKGWRKGRDLNPRYGYPYA
jgi:site-specific DNA recombinase